MIWTERTSRLELLFLVHNFVDIVFDCIKHASNIHNMVYVLMKESEGGAESFGDGLKVGIYKEAVPMGVDQSEVSFVHAGEPFRKFIFVNFCVTSVFDTE